MAINEDTKLEELERIKGELKELLPLLSKWRVEELQKQLSEFYMHKWKKRRIPKYGSLNKGFTTEELHKFLSIIKEQKYRLLFEYQGFLGLRIGEAVKLNMKDIEFNTRILRVHTEKAHTLDTLIIPPFLFDETIAYIKEHTAEIDKAQGYLFYADKQKSHSKEPYVNPNYVRNVFRRYLSLTGLNDIYDTSVESIEGRAERSLHRLSTHSLRHHAITTFNRSVQGNVTLTKAFARHQDLSSTQVYIYTSKEELYRAIDGAFDNNNEIVVR